MGKQDKRRTGYDTKGRKLLPGETQEKNGRYRYTYYVNRVQKCFYSWKLEDTDRLPKGKRPCESLRSKIKELRLQHNLSQAELATQSGVKLRNIQMYEQRYHDIDKAQAQTVYKLSRVLGCNMEDLLENPMM